MKRRESVDERDELRSLNAQAVPSVWTLIIPLLAGTAVYFAFAEKLESVESQSDWWEELLEVSPALMVGFFFLAFVLLPLRMLFARMPMDNPRLFLAVSTLIWLALSAIILRGTNALAQGDPWVDASVIVPGLVVVAVFALMNRYSNPRHPH